MSEKRTLIRKRNFILGVAATACIPIVVSVIAFLMDGSHLENAGSFVRFALLGGLIYAILGALIILLFYRLR